MTASSTPTRKTLESMERTLAHLQAAAECTNWAALDCPTSEATHFAKLCAEAWERRDVYRRQVAEYAAALERAEHEAALAPYKGVL